ncbi:MAG: transglycosylase SLT domain-containing protein [Thermodesulfovibrionales bacterium]
MAIGAETDNLFPECVSVHSPAGLCSKVALRNFGWIIRCALCVVLSCLFFPPNVASGADGREYVKNGKCDLDAGRYEEAVKKLTLAIREFPLLEDYSLLYLSTAYHQLGDHKKSLDAVRTLVQKYPQSPLVRKARSAEVREARENPGEKLLQVFDSYTKDYPEDEEMNLAYGLFLKQSGDIGRAKEVFKKIYLRAGLLSQTAYAELSPSDLSVPDTLERAANLMKRNEFKEAERELRRALPACDGMTREEVLRNIGLSLFRQKEYTEAAEIYDKINDVFFKARSLYRAGDKRGFVSALKELMGKNDKRAGGLLIAFAGDKRREGDFEGALNIYDDVLSRYPSDAEEAMWGIGWTHYVAADYRKAAGVFLKLYAKYEDPKYLYWQARSSEASGEDAKALYGALAKHENNFYMVLSAARGKIRAGDYLSGNIPDDSEAGEQRQFERADVLLSLNMTGEANAELQWIARKIETPLALVAAASRFQKIGDYKRSVTLAAKMPYSDKLHRFWYPMAFWDDVEKTSKKHDIDPMIALSVMREESRFDPDARSVAGARGLMQLMPHTAYRLDKSVGLGIRKDSQINDARNNIHLGVYYLKSLFKEFKSLPYVLAAYNAGEVIVKKWEQQSNHKAADEFIEDIPYAETRNYVKKVMTSYFQYKRSSVSESISASLPFGNL